MAPDAVRRLRSIVVNPIVTALVVFAVLMGATLLGSSLGRRLPTNQVTGETWSSVSLGLGFISSMAATQSVRALLLDGVKSLASMDWVKKELASSDARTSLVARCYFSPLRSDGRIASILIASFTQMSTSCASRSAAR